MQAYMVNPFNVEGIVIRNYTPKEEETIMVNPEDGLMYTVKPIGESQSEQHDPMVYTKVYQLAYLKLKNMSFVALKVFNYAVYTARLGKDIVFLNCADVMQQCGISKASYYIAIKELIENEIIAKKLGSSIEFWVNTNMFFNGNRIKLIKK